MSQPSGTVRGSPISPGGRKAWSHQGTSSNRHKCTPASEFNLGEIMNSKVGHAQLQVCIDYLLKEHCNILADVEHMERSVGRSVRRGSP